MYRVSTATRVPMNKLNYTVSGPYTHENLTLFLLHSPDTVAPDVYLTLAEALDRRYVVVHETGNVGELLIENLAPDKDLFVQAGEILKGGRQDRTVGVDFVVPARTKLPLPTFCVESARWHRRGAEPANVFSSSGHYLSSKALKLAAKRHASQGEVWRAVAEAQQKLSSSVAACVAAPQSPSSLELSLEHEKVIERRRAYLEAFAQILDDHPDAVGFVFAINGKLNSAEAYASHALFTKLWKKLLEAAVVEAVAESGGTPASSPLTVEAVQQLLAEAAAAGQHEARPITDRVTLHIKSAPRTVVFETEDKKWNGACIHSNSFWGAECDESCAVRLHVGRRQPDLPKEETQLKLREKDLLLEQMRAQIEELKKRAEQGPQERQGEAQELELEDRLRAQFPFDQIEPIKKGERGADILQKVQNRLGHACGTILWESKRAKNWSDAWVSKLKTTSATRERMWR